MATLTSTGIGSGLDVGTIVSSLMSLEKQPLTKLQASASTIQTQLSAFGALKSQLASFGDIATRLASPGTWSPLSAASSDSDAISVTAGTSAAAGRYRLEVQQLAQSQSLASAPFASAAASVVGTGSLTFTVGTASGASFTPAAGSTPVTVAIDSAHQTLSGVRDAINAASAGVTASIVGTGSSARLVLRTPDGAAHSVKVTASDADGNDTDASGLSALAFDPAGTAGSGRNLTQTQAAQDARFTLDGLAQTSETNTPSEVLAGVSLTLRQVTTAAVDVTVSVDTASVRRNVTDFVNAYNATAKLLAQDTQVDPAGKNRGPLQADSTAEGLQYALRGMLFGGVTGLGSPNSLSAAGIELQRDGTLKINDSKLTPLLSAPQSLARLFAQAQSGSDASTRGIAVRFKEWASGFTADGGILSARITGLKSRVDDNQKRQDAMQDRLVATEARLRKQYQQLDTQMSSLNAQMARMRSSLGLNGS